VQLLEDEGSKAEGGNEADFKMSSADDVIVAGCKVQPAELGEAVEDDEDNNDTDNPCGLP